MGSGVLLAILVALWFVVLVPMVVTRGDLASAPAEPMRVLRRRSERSAMSSEAISPRDREQGRSARTGKADTMHTEPIPVLPRRVPGAAMAAEEAAAAPSKPKEPQQPEPVRAEKQKSETPAKEQPVRTATGLRARRRRMLTTLIGFALLFAGLAAFWQPMFWWPQVVLDLAVFSYLVFLRLEAQREQDRRERRLARAVTKVRLPEDRTERAVRKHTEYRAVVTAVSGNQAISLDDDDPGFADMPTYRPSAEEVAQASAWHERKAV